MSIRFQTQWVFWAVGWPRAFASRVLTARRTLALSRKLKGNWYLVPEVIMYPWARQWTPKCSTGATLQAMYFRVSEYATWRAHIQRGCVKGQIQVTLSVVNEVIFSEDPAAFWGSRAISLAWSIASQPGVIIKFCFHYLVWAGIMTNVYLKDIYVPLGMLPWLWIKPCEQVTTKIIFFCFLGECLSMLSRLLLFRL